MEIIGFWTPQDEKDGKGDTLVYLLAFPSREAAKKSWDAFQADPEWKKAREASEKDGKIVKKVDVGLPRPDRLQRHRSESIRRPRLRAIERWTPPPRGRPAHVDLARRHPRRRRAARPVGTPDARADLADARRAVRRVGLPQVRELPARRRVQVPRAR